MRELKKNERKGEKMVMRMMKIMRMRIVKR